MENTSKTYSLTNTSFRNTINLKNYQDIIKKSVQQVIPNATVIVDIDSFTVTPVTTRKESIQLGKTLSKTLLGQFSKINYSLFKSKPSMK